MGKTGYLLTHQPKSFDWRERNARLHRGGTGHAKLLTAALKRFDAVFGIYSHRAGKTVRTAKASTLLG